MGEALYALGESEQGVACLQKALVASLDPVPPKHLSWGWFVCKEMMVQLRYRLFGAPP
jgi:hypothetical protein